MQGRWTSIARRSLALLTTLGEECEVCCWSGGGTLSSEQVSTIMDHPIPPQFLVERAEAILQVWTRHPSPFENQLE